MTEPTPTTARGPYRPHHARARTERPAFQFQPRDLELMEAIWDNRFLTLSLLVPLFPSDPARTPAHIRQAAAAIAPTRLGTNLGRRLSALYHHGYLDRIRSVRGGEFVYALGQRGARLLRDHQPDLPIPNTDWTEKNRTISPLFVDHALMPARLRLALTLATRTTPSVTLDTFLPEARSPRHKWTHGGQDVYVNPDAFFVLRETDQAPNPKRHFFVEADRSTMTVQKKMRQKYAYYSALRTDRLHREPPFRLPGFRVLTVCRTNSRVLNLLKLVAGADSGIPPDHRAMFLFTTEETYAAHPENVLAAVWRDASDPQQPRALITSPRPRL